MSTLVVMSTVLVASSLLCILVNSWLVIWIALEMNTMAYCLIMGKTKSPKPLKSTEMSMKYLIIQSISSAMLIFSMMTTKETMITLSTVILMGVISLLIKSATSPFHQWFITITKNLSWNNALILMTWQKLAPVYLISFQTKKNIIPFIMLTALIGSTLQMNKKNMMEILGLSSVFNLSWMLLSIITSMKTFFIFSILYWSSVMLVIVMLKKSKQTEISEESNKMMNKWALLFTAANLAGIPPMAGFLAKWTVLMEWMKMNLLAVTSSILILSAVNFYIYLRMFTEALMKNPTKKQKTMEKQKKIIVSSIVIMSIIPSVMLPMLGNAWNKGLFW